MSDYKPKKKPKRDWCSGGGKMIDWEWNHDKKWNTSPDLRKVKYARCSVCNQRFEVINRECEDAHCWHKYIPKHKAY